MKLRLLYVLLALATFSFASAEESQKQSYWFGGVQGGLQFVSTNYNIPDLTTPEFGIQVGHYFVPELGARLSIQGFQTKGGFNSVRETYSFKHITSDLDMLFNLTNIFSKQKDHRLNLVFVAGLGLTNGWDNNEIFQWRYKEKNVLIWKDLLTSNFRLGAMLDWNVTERWAANLELDANFHGDKFNSKHNNSFDFQPTAMVGINYKFGHKKSAGSAADAADEVIAQPAPVEEKPAPVEKTTVPAPEKMIPVEVPDAPATPAQEPVAPAALVEEPAPAPAPVAAEKIDAAPLSTLPGTESARPVSVKPFVVRTAEDLKVDIFFEKGSARIDEESQSKLYGIADWAKNRKVVVYIKGYADKGSGTPEGNKKLSDKRAHDIANEITKYGFRLQDMEVTSYGDTVQPFEENDKNRVVRIEVRELL